MKKAAICFTKDGKALIERLNEELTKAGLEKAKAYISMQGIESDDDFESVTDLKDWTGRQFEDHNALIFVGAMGIAIRAISSFVKDKLSDSPVIVIDDLARFVIPVIGGHGGGANKLASVISKLIDAEAIITTSTDSHLAFSADVFAVENSLKICNREGIKKVSAKAIEGKPITLSIKDYPPDKPVDIIIADATDREYDLLFAPKRYTVGIGMKRDTDKKKAEEFLLDVLLNIVRCDIINRMKLYKHFVFPKPLSIAQHCKKILSFKKVSGMFQSHFYHFLNIYSFMQDGVDIIIITELAATKHSFHLHRPNRLDVRQLQVVLKRNHLH